MLGNSSLKNRFLANLRAYKKRPFSLIIRLLVYLSAIITLGILIFIVGHILINGLPYINADIFAWEYTSENSSMMPAIINTLIMTFISLLIAVPLGIFSAIYLVEYSKKGNKITGIVRVTAETLTGIPSIIYGLFGFLFFVIALDWGYSIISGSCTLAIMVLPVIMRSTEEALLSVPDSYREASFGLWAGKLII